MAATNDVTTIERTGQLPHTYWTGQILSLPNPAARGGIHLGVWRARILDHAGAVIFKPTGTGRIHAQVHAKENAPPTAQFVTLAMIARDDPEGLTRAIISALPHVDQIIIGVDGRSDEWTFKTALTWADEVVSFDAEDIGMSVADWEADKIDFAAARNFVTRRVTTPWVLTLDTDEMLDKVPATLRRHLYDTAEDIDTTPVTVDDGSGNTAVDSQRIVRSHLRWSNPTHNRLNIKRRGENALGVHIVQDRSVRSPKRNAARDAQRSAAMADMQVKANLDDLWAMFHVIKDLYGKDKLVEGRKFLKRYIDLTDPHGPQTEGRSYACIVAAAAYYRGGHVEEAEYWATAALRDGPRIEAFLLLGGMAEDAGRHYQAMGWYQAASVCPPLWHHRWPEVVATRNRARDGLMRKMMDAALRGKRIGNKAGADTQRFDLDKDSRM